MKIIDLLNARRDEDEPFLSFEVSGADHCLTTAVFRITVDLCRRESDMIQTAGPSNFVRLNKRINMQDVIRTRQSCDQGGGGE
jgi:hypothetical protein